MNLEKYTEYLSDWNPEIIPLADTTNLVVRLDPHIIMLSRGNLTNELQLSVSDGGLKYTVLYQGKDPETIKDLLGCLLHNVRFDK